MHALDRMTDNTIMGQAVQTSPLGAVAPRRQRRRQLEDIAQAALAASTTLTGATEARADGRAKIDG